MKGRRSPPFELCQICARDGKVFSPRDVDAQCLICGERFCAAHIGQHLSFVHCVSLKLDHCRRTTPEPENETS